MADDLFANAEVVAVKRPLGELARGLSRRFRVPLECALFLRYPDGRRTLHRPDEEVDCRRRALALLVRTTPMEVAFDFEDLPAAPTEDERETAVDVHCRFSLRVPQTPTELESFLERAVGERRELSRDDLRDLLETPSRACLADYCRDLSTQDLLASDHTPAVERALREALKPITFNLGLEFLGVDKVDLVPRVRGVGRRIVERARWFLLVSGDKLLLLDPRAGDLSLRVLREFAGPLGPLRSVRLVEVGSRPHIAVGARDGVYLVEAEDPARHSPRPYPLPGRTQGRFGVNAAAVAGGCLYATHSEHGLVVWDLDRPGRPGECLLTHSTARARSCRQVQPIGGGRLALAVGSEVVLVDPARPSVAPVAYAGVGEEITALLWTPAGPVAGTRGGTLLLWEAETPARPRTLLRVSRPIHSLALVHIDGDPSLLVCSGEYGVGLVGLDGVGGRFFQSDCPTRLATGADDFVAALDHSRTVLLLWDTSQPTGPMHTEPVRPITGHSVQDLVCWRGPADE